MSDDNFISRWSRRKLQSKAAPTAQPDRPTADPTRPADALPAQGAAVVPAQGVVPAQAGTESPLPPIESLTLESDFTPFMGSDVDPGLRRAALKTLFKDPRFNVMDGMDVYIDDYSKPDPLPEGWLEKMNQVARLGDYRPPARADESANVAAEEEKIESEQAVVIAPIEPPADTSAQVLPSSQSEES